MGFLGAQQARQWTQPLPTVLAGQIFHHSFIMPAADTVCHSGQWLMTPESEPTPTVDMYWARLEPETPLKPGLIHQFLLWKPWLNTLWAYLPQLDPYHWRIYYYRNHNLLYMENFAYIQGDPWDITSTHIYAAREGVAASYSLTPAQMTWFKMQEKSVTHISLALSPGHEARKLGHMVKRLTKMSDWEDIPLPNVQISKFADAYCIIVSDAPLTTNMIILEHRRDDSDHDDAESLLNKLPKFVWSSGPFDVGYCTKTPDIKITVFPGYHVYRPQYPWPAAANQGMEDTLTGLWNSGVLETSTPSWCTPLRPVFKNRW
ncbi:BLOC-1-related complex subunit 7 isoform X1 [Syngnathoides biaculeatus]|uniref:BLOC-1-related complex subunit 7 isoform X1 n=1 Tax=Syngnathoides biaculeatus TaxID=300417 RepID=UPI002ADD9D8C|nr:BLOC-1-related complex subunit 7 isoform X1 [Syngnathoides biaculeatus]